MNRCAQMIAEAKQRKGNPAMSDQALGDKLGGIRQSDISRAKRTGYMIDPLALALAEALGMHPAEVLIIARAERENDAKVKAAFVDYVGKMMASAAKMVTALAVALPALILSPQPAEAHTGGEGRFRRKPA